MFIPLGPVGERVRAPRVTLALIVVNCVVFLAVRDRVSRDEKALAKPAAALSAVETAIELEHRGPAALMQRGMGLGRAYERSRQEFWWRWKQGYVVPRDDPSWRAWDAARAKFRDAHHGTLHYRWGWKRDAPSFMGFLGHAFLHGDFGHLLGNMLFLWAAGVAIEDSWGRTWFAILYAVGIVGSVLADFVFLPSGLDMPGIGASGAVAAVMGALAVRHFRLPMRVASVVPVPGVYTIATGWLLLPWFIVQAVSASSEEAATSGVGFGAHVGGFVAGAAVALAVRLTRVEDMKLAPEREAQRRSALKRTALEEAGRHFARSKADDGIAALRRALDADPDDVALRQRLVETLALLSRGDELRAEGIDLLQRLWRLGRKDEFGATWAWLDGRGVPRPAALAHRAAPLLEDRAPALAAAAYVQALTEAADDPLALASYRRYEALLARHGEAEKAAQVRALGDACERKRRDRGLA